MSRVHAGHLWGAITVCVGLILLVLLMPNLAGQRLAQGIAALSMTLLVAIVIFAIVQTPTVKQLTGIAGPLLQILLPVVSAAGFYFALFDKVQEVFWPAGPTMITGMVTFEGTSYGVEGVEVRVPNTGQTDRTDESGEFKIPGVHNQVTELRFRYGSVDVMRPITASGRYPVVPRFDTLTTAARTIDPQAWQVVNENQCPTEGAGAVTLYRLLGTLRLAADGPPEDRRSSAESMMYLLRIETGRLGRITHAQSVGPISGFARQLPPDAPEQLWVFSTKVDSVPVELELCAESGATGSALPRASYSVELIHRVAGETK